MPKRSTINNQLAKAETLLVLGLFSESLMGPWLAAQPWPRWVKILLKMAIIIGCFGPVLQLLERVIDGSLATTRAAATAAFSGPKFGTHALILAVLYLIFYWTTYKSLPF
jgi:hypothetical protein